MDIWSVLIFKVRRRRIPMVILLESVTTQFRRLFWHISYYKLHQSNFIAKCDRLLLQSAPSIKKCDRLLLQSTSGITKCDRLLLQSASGITKCHRFYYKVRQVLQICYKVRRNRGEHVYSSQWNNLKYHIAEPILKYTTRNKRYVT